MLFRSCASVVCCLGLIAMVAAAKTKDKQHDWRTGKALDVEHNPYFTGISSNSSVEGAPATAGPGGTTEVNGNASSTSIAVYNTYQKYVIESERYVYLVEERIHFRWSKSARITVNGPVQYAVEKERIYLLDKRGKVHETWIVKVVDKV